MIHLLKLIASNNNLQHYKFQFKAFRDLHTPCTEKNAVKFFHYILLVFHIQKSPGSRHQLSSSFRNFSEPMYDSSILL
jgi:hypothetical protein